MSLYVNVSGRDVCGLRRLPSRRQDARCGTYALVVRVAPSTGMPMPSASTLSQPLSSLCACSCRHLERHHAHVERCGHTARCSPNLLKPAVRCCADLCPPVPKLCLAQVDTCFCIVSISTATIAAGRLLVRLDNTLKVPRRPHRRSAGDASPAHTPCDGSQRAAAPARDTAAHGWFRRAAAVIAQPPPPPEPTGLAAILMPVSSALHALVTFYPWPFYLLVRTRPNAFSVAACRRCQHIAACRLQMALKPHAKITRDLLAGARTLVPLALIYTLLLAASWSPDSLKLLLPGSFSQGVSNMLAGKFSVQFLPTVDSVGLLLSEPLAALSAWAHLQFISFFLARWIWMDGACVLDRCV